MFIVVFIVYALGCLFWLMQGGAPSTAMLLVGLVLWVLGSAATRLSERDIRTGAWWMLANRHRGRW